MVGTACPVGVLKADNPENPFRAFLQPTAARCARLNDECGGWDLLFHASVNRYSLTKLPDSGTAQDCPNIDRCGLRNGRKESLGVMFWWMVS